MSVLLDTDPIYHFTWNLVPFNGATEHEFEWQLKVSCDYLPLGETGFTHAETEKLNAFFGTSAYHAARRSYTMESFREEYASFKSYADVATQEIIKKAL